MSNEAKKFISQPIFRRVNNGKEEGSLTIGDVLDKFTKKQGVACDGVINGIAFGGTTTNRLSFEVINSVDSLVIRDCAGDIVFQTASAIDPQEFSAQYRATLTASDGAYDSTAVSKNTLNAAIVWEYVGEGVYTGTLVGAFPAGRTTPLVSLGTATGGVILKLVRTSNDVLTLSTFAVDGTTPADFIGTVSVNITVDPA